MKTYITLFISTCLLLGQLNAQTQVPNYVPTNGLVGWWPFNGNANDESGNGNNGTVNGATLTTDRFGNADNAYNFSGSNNYVLINNGLISNTFGSFSISLWFKTNTTNVGTFISDRGAVNWKYKYMIQINNPTAGKYTFGTHDGGSLTNSVVAIQSNLNQNSWTNLTAVLNASSMTMSIYLNGVLSNQITGINASAWNPSTTATYIGKWISPFGDYHYYTGLADDFGVWNRALTQAEITGLYEATSPFNAVSSSPSICVGQPVTLSVNTLQGSISALTCASATNNGTLTAGVAASGVSSVVPYTGGNGGIHNGQTVTSTGVTGLTATLNAGTFSTGSGNLTYTITGTPSGIGTASFALNIGGQTCTLTRTVVAGTITGLTCASATNNGTLIAGVAASGVSSVVPYTGGNGGMQNGQTVTSTGITGLTATLVAGSFASGAGSLTYTITGTPSGIGTASFLLNIGGQTCTLTRTVVAGTITGLSCSSATNNGTLIAGVAANGVSSVVPYTGGNGGMHNGQTVTSTGVTGLTATLTAGTFAIGSGSLTYTITGTPSATGTASFALNIGGQTCTISRTVTLAGTITALTCASATNNGTLIFGVAASGVSSNVPYTGGNGGSHYGQTISSTGVTGLTATLLGGAFVVGSGSVTYTITGTPNSTGTASFALNIGGRTCTLTRTVDCWSLTNTTSVVEVTNPTTGKTWMDRNLGAVRQATSSTDVFGYGDLYQWGRNSDGHQCRNSLTTTTLSSTDQATNSNFIVVSSTAPGDWRSPQNNNLWQGINGINNPCPSGFRVPTYTELNAEATSWTVANAYASVLKIPAGGGRLSVSPNNGTLASAGVGGVYWTSTISGTTSRNISFGTLDAGLTAVTRSDGMSVRCIKETVGSIGALNCGSSTQTGNLISGVAASGVSVSVPYTGGNGGFYTAQSISSTGVIGLTATISQGLFASGAGSLTYTITGTPSTSGTASFALTIGGQSCTLNLTVVVNPSSQYPAGSVYCTEPTLIVDVTNPTTGKTWMDRNLGATRVATSSTDANAYGDLYQWGRRSDGHQCRNSATTTTLSSTDTPANGSFIRTSTSPFDWRSPQNTNLWQGVFGINNLCPSGYRLPTETELNNERLSWSLNTSTGAFASPLKFTGAGGRDSNTGSLGNVGTGGFYSSSTINGTNSSYLYFNSNSANISFNYRAVGYSVRCIKETVGSIGALNCGSSTQTGNLISGTAASGVSASVPYTGGNGGYYAAQSVISTGVTGLTASISQGLFTSGIGNLVYAISGTPSASGTASFALSIGGKSCTLTIVVYGVQPAYAAGAVFCNGATIVNDVINPTTGKTWMDRNLGASQTATSSTDANSYGDLYQWGRGIDGHQCRNSTIEVTSLAVSDQPGITRFITNNAQTNTGDWRNPQNNNLWQGVNGINNPCPNGYRVPTSSEIDAERLSWSSNNSIGAFASPLKLPLAGDRLGSNGFLYDVGSSGVYWSSTVSTIYSNNVAFGASSAGIYSNVRSCGYSIRCIKETAGSVGALNCGGSTVTGNLISGSSASGVSVSVPYTGGNGGFYVAQSISSTGVTGLTATLSQGLFASGAGNLVYSISGTPSSSGTASFALSIGGQSCTLSINVYGVQPAFPTGSVNCNGTTVINDVTNPTTGKTWMDRNLGAIRVATSSTDASAYGDLYQWGRNGDGHHCRNSLTTTTLSSTDQAATPYFILAAGGGTGDWRSPQNSILWQGINGINNPCPIGYRLPTQTEFNSEKSTWSINSNAGAFGSPLKLPAGGGRLRNIGQNGTIVNIGTGGVYWTSTTSGNASFNIFFGTVDTGLQGAIDRASGNSVRCIKN